MFRLPTYVSPLVRRHFGNRPLAGLTLTDRHFPGRVAADLNRGMDRLPDAGFAVIKQLVPVGQTYNHPVVHFPAAYHGDWNNPVVTGAAHYQEVDVGEDRPVRCLTHGLWLLEWNGTPLAVLMNGADANRSFFSAATAAGPEGDAAASAFYRHLEASFGPGSCYRGKIISLEQEEHYGGQNVGVRVHQLREVARDELVLPRATLELLERNVIRFVEQRPHLAKLGLATRKGLLFYGPPGTGKTHTIHYLARAVPGQTTLLVTAEQVGLLSEYMTLARLFQPSMVILEDVDLIARDRTQMQTPGQESLLNRLLNEMDGLRPGADVLFILTTNRPEALEPALAARPGRVDQAIEFPYPDDDGRAKLVRLYRGGVEAADELVELIVRRTAGVSAAFIKELMRRAAQFALEAGRPGVLAAADVDAAMDEMVFAGGALNRTLLGAADRAWDA